MTQLPKLEVGRVYFGLAYEDDNFTRPIVHSYEYLGTNINSVDKDDEDAVYFFRFLGSGDSLELTEHQLDLVVDLQGLVEMLRRWREKNPDLAG